MPLAELKYKVSKGENLTHWFKNQNPDFKVQAGCDLTVDESSNTRIVNCIFGPALIMKNATGEVVAHKHTQITVRGPNQ